MRQMIVLVVIIVTALLLAGCTQEDVTDIVSSGTGGDVCNEAVSALKDAVGDDVTVDSCVCSGKRSDISAASYNGSGTISAARAAVVSATRGDKSGLLQVAVFKQLNGSWNAHAPEQGIVWDEFTSESSVNLDDYAATDSCTPEKLAGAFGHQCVVADSFTDKACASCNCPRDNDDDGLAEDVDGNGTFTVEDAQVFNDNFQDLSGAVWDYNGDGTVDVQDAQEILDEFQ